MIYIDYHIQVKGSMPNAKLVVYIQEYSKDMAIQKRPLILLCPGGGYGRTSDRESEPMVLKFLAMGYHVALLRYSCAPARFPTALLELAGSMMLIREHAEEWHIDAKKVVVQGCSAGGHLAASLGMFWHEEFLAKELGAANFSASDKKSGTVLELNIAKELNSAKEISTAKELSSDKEPGGRDFDSEILKPYGMILCYPVITSGEFAHRGSFVNLLGEGEEDYKQEEKARLLEKLSLEKQVSARTPRTFIWHTYEDQSVPVENSLLLVEALKKAGISTEFHMYARGAHGLALANRLTATADGRAIQEECSTWTKLAETWLERLFEGEAE